MHLDSAFWPHRAGARALLGISILALCAVAQATNIYVSPSGNDNNSGLSFSQPVQDLTTALQIANNGDTILLEDGVYTGSADLDINIPSTTAQISATTFTIKSINGPSKVIIDCQASSTPFHGLFYFTGAGNASTPTVIQGVTIQNAFRGASGGAISSASGYLSFVNCIFNTNSCTNYFNSGGAIYSQGGGLTLTSCTFQSNNAYGYGGGVYTDPNCVLVAKSCTFAGNTAGNGAGLQADGSAKVSSCLFSKNVAGSGALALNGTATVTVCTFASNNTGGLYGGNQANLGIHECTFTNNNNSGLNLGNSIAVVDYSYFSGNQTSGSGGAVDAYNEYPSSSTTTLNNCIFLNNLSGGGGGAIAENGQSMQIQFCSFANNADIGQNGGGAVYVAGGNCTITNSILWGDQASQVPVAHELATSGSGSLSATYSDIQTRLKGSGNISLNPLYFNANTGDLHVMGGSPCYGAGTAISGITKDYQFTTRRNPPTIGAFEGASAWGLVAEAVGPDLVDHVLFSDAAGQAKLGKIVSGTLQSTTLPLNGMTPQYLAIGPNESIYILWTHSTDNNVTVTLTPTTGTGTSTTITAPAGGLISGFSVSADKSMHLNWQKDTGAVVLQKITSGAVSTLVTVGPL